MPVRTMNGLGACRLSGSPTTDMDAFLPMAEE